MVGPAGLRTVIVDVYVSTGQNGSVSVGVAMTDAAMPRRAKIEYFMVFVCGFVSSVSGTEWFRSRINGIREVKNLVVLMNDALVERMTSITNVDSASSEWKATERTKVRSEVEAKASREERREDGTLFHILHPGSLQVKKAIA